MARDHDDVHDVESMDDDEVRDLIIQLVEEEAAIDADRVEVSVRNGLVRVSGRLGTEDEVEAVEKIVVDQLGIERFENELVVDELARSEVGDAPDDAAMQRARTSGERTQRGDRTDPGAEHLMSDVEGELYGTEDLQKAIEQGESYSPPDTPHEEGTRSRERH